MFQFYGIELLLVSTIGQCCFMCYKIGCPIGKNHLSPIFVRYQVRTKFVAQNFSYLFWNLTWFCSSVNVWPQIYQFGEYISANPRGCYLIHFWRVSEQLGGRLRDSMGVE